MLMSSLLFPLLLFLALFDAACTFTRAMSLPSGIQSGLVSDWLLSSPSSAVQSSISEVLGTHSSCQPALNCLVLSNGLVSRYFSLQPFGTIDLYTSSSQRSIFRAFEPEALVSLDNVNYIIGELDIVGQTAYANRSEWILQSNGAAWHFDSYSVSEPVKLYEWKPVRNAENRPWPPTGLHLDLSFLPPASVPPQHQGVTVHVHYEIYDGIPAYTKWLTIELDAAKRDRFIDQHAQSDEFQRHLDEQNIGLSSNVGHDQLNLGDIIITGATVEILAVELDYSPLVFQPYPTNPPLIKTGAPAQLVLATDWPHATQVVWDNDQRQGTVAGSAQARVSVRFLMGPGEHLSATSPVFTSFRVQEIVTDTLDRERHGLSIRQVMRTIAPQITENPVLFHLTDASSTGIRNAADKLSEVGFEMIILSFFTAFNMENLTASYLKRMQSDIAYANSKGIEVGGYDLICWTRLDNVKFGAVDPSTNKTHGDSCFASDWYDTLLSRITTFVEQTGLSAIETDGPYPGYVCASQNHAHHDGLEDSVYQQTSYQNEFYRQMRNLGLYIHQPDNYFFAGANRAAMGYDEDQYSLPRWQDLTVSRQGMFEDTYLFPVTAGWMLLPIEDYHSGGDSAAFSPLSQHLLEYEWGLAQYFGMGVAACYRGAQPYDTPEVSAVVRKWTSFYKRHRSILISDIIHVQRATLTSLDWFIHVNPSLSERGLAMVFNPTTTNITRLITLPLYYSGLTELAFVQEQENSASGRLISIDRSYSVQLSVHLPPLGITWFLITAPTNVTIAHASTTATPIAVIKHSDKSVVSDS